MNTENPIIEKLSDFFVNLKGVETFKKQVHLVSKIERFKQHKKNGYTSFSLLIFYCFFIFKYKKALVRVQAFNEEFLLTPSKTNALLYALELHNYSDESHSRVLKEFSQYTITPNGLYYVLWLLQKYYIHKKEAEFKSFEQDFQNFLSTPTLHNSPKKEFKPISFFH
jgi:hypothetical protein